MHHDFNKIEIDKLLNVTSLNFEEVAIHVFNYQYKNNYIYNSFCKAINIDSSKVQKLNQIPFLPISFFRTHNVVTGKLNKFDIVFESSGTTDSAISKHYVHDINVYKQSLIKGFEQFYGKPENYTILALLPSYIERKNASLVYMAKTLMEISKKPYNGFYINEWDKLKSTLQILDSEQQKTILIGVTFALLDFANEFSDTQLQNTIVMETGGMKGRKTEMTRNEVHCILKQKFCLQQIHSEYGMTELLSQAYSKADGIFYCTNTMKVLIRDINDPFEINNGGTGCINIIDLANVHSCSFIATDDIGNLKTNGAFEVLGRLDNSILRGCNLMVI